MNRGNLIEVIIYGYSDERMNLELPENIEPSKGVMIANELLENVTKYMVEKLRFKRDHIYIFVENEFKSLKSFRFKSFDQIDCGTPFVVAYADFNLAANLSAQRQIFKELSLDINPSDKKTPSISTNDKESQHSDSSFEKVQIDFNERKSKFSLTSGFSHKRVQDDMAMENIDLIRETLPYSTTKYVRIQNNKLLPPSYFENDFVKENYNNSLTILYSADFKAFVVNSKGELVLVDKHIIDSSRGVLKEIIAKATMMILRGHGLLKMSMPVRIFDTKSQIEKFSDIFNSLHYMKRVVEAVDKLERVKLLICMFTSTFFYGIGSRKPFNPYLGETFQGYFKDGSKLYIEHLQHEPPVDAVFLINEELGFRMHGTFEFKVKLKPNEVTVIFGGLLTVEIGDDKIYVELAHLVNSGLIYGDRKLKLKEAFYFYYPSAKLKAMAKLGPSNSNKRVDSISGGIYPQKTLVQVDRHIGDRLFSSSEIKKLPKEPLVNITGSWLSSLKLDGEEQWNSNTPGLKVQIVQDPLPSDWRYREDLLWLIQGNLKMADDWKVELEHIQRTDRKARVNTAKCLKKKHK